MKEKNKPSFTKGIKLELKDIPPAKLGVMVTFPNKKPIIVYK